MKLQYSETLYDSRLICNIIPWYRRKFRQILKNDPSIVGVVSTGSSGAILATILLTDQKLKTRKLLHIHANKAEGHYGKTSGIRFAEGNFVFVDDFTETGKSLRRCINRLQYRQKIVHLLIDHVVAHSSGIKLIKQLGIPITFRGQRKYKKSCN